MTPWHLALGVLGLLIVANRRASLASVIALLDDDLEQAQGGGATDAVLSALDPATYWPAMTDAATSSANVAAFLVTIREAEGTTGYLGYRLMFGFRTFNDYADHPRQPAQFTDGQGRTLWTSAAGAYQFMAVSPIPGGGSTKVNTWDRIRAKLGLPDFSPASQDLAALELVDECGATNDVKAGRLDAAIDKCRKVWASLPGAGYGQPERRINDLRAAFAAAGGTLA